MDDQRAPTIQTIMSGCETPLLSLRYSNLIKPFYYANSPNVPRYSVTCVFMPKEHQKFYSDIRQIETSEKISTILKKDKVYENGSQVDSGALTVKFQCRDPIPVFIHNEDSDDLEELQITDELPRGDMVKVKYNIMRYAKKNSDPPEYGVSFRAISVTWFPHEVDL